MLWHNDLGGVTWDLGDATVLKWSPPGAPGLAREIPRLEWAGRFTPVPEGLSHGADRDGEWLLMRRIPGDSAVSPGPRAHPRRTVEALGASLRRFHDALPADLCPFTWSPLERARSIEPATPPEVLARIADPPPVDRTVVCHGDACNPNTLVDDDGRVTGHVDLGSLGVADRWADIAVATMSLAWNFDGDWEDVFLDAYGVVPDPARTAYYRDLWNHTTDTDLVPAAGSLRSGREDARGA